MYDVSRSTAGDQDFAVRAGEMLLMIFHDPVLHPRTLFGYSCVHGCKTQSSRFGSSPRVDMLANRPAFRIGSGTKPPLYYFIGVAVLFLAMVFVSTGLRSSSRISCCKAPSAFVGRPRIGDILKQPLRIDPHSSSSSHFGRAPCEYFSMSPRKSANLNLIVQPSPLFCLSDDGAPVTTVAPRGHKHPCEYFNLSPQKNRERTTL